MKVVMLLTQDRGGPADLAVSVAQELAARTGSPQIILVGPVPVSSAGRPQSHLHQAHVRSKRDLRGFRAVSKLLEDIAPDIIHAQDRRAGLVASLAAGARKPVVLTFHGVPDSAAGRWVQAGPLRGRHPGLAGGSRLVADALIARRVACTVAPSRAIAGFLQRELRVPARRLRVLHNGVAIPPDRQHRHAVRTFATVSSFAPCKATPALVEAFLAAASKHADLRLLMVGDGPDRRECEELVARSGRPRQVEFTGYRADVAAQLGQADAFVLPSLNENLPLALLQAMAMGLPCIAADVGGIPEALDVSCGILVPPGDISALTAAMEQLIRAPGLGDTLGGAARTRVAEMFPLSRCADQHLELWQDILEERRG